MRNHGGVSRRSSPRSVRKESLPTVAPPVRAGDRSTVPSVVTSRVGRSRKNADSGAFRSRSAHGAGLFGVDGPGDQGISGIPGESLRRVFRNCRADTAGFPGFESSAAAVPPAPERARSGFTPTGGNGRGTAHRASVGSAHPAAAAPATRSPVFGFAWSLTRPPETSPRSCRRHAAAPTTRARGRAAARTLSRYSGVITTLVGLEHVNSTLVYQLGGVQMSPLVVKLPSQYGGMPPENQRHFTCTPSATR